MQSFVTPPLSADESSASHRNLRLGALAVAYFLLLWSPGVLLGESGYYIDEFYYIACAKHLAFGYVDHPPFSIWLLSAIRALDGDALWVLRLAPALAGATTALLAARLARKLGADGFGQCLAAASVMLSVSYQVIFSFYSMNALEILMWTACMVLLVEIEQQEEPRLWLLVGLILGIAIENKHTIVLYIGALGLGMLLAPARRHLASKWFWMAMAFPALMLLPNLAWQAANGWPSAEFYRNQDLYKNVATPPLQVVLTQILAMNPATLPIWVAGVAWLLGASRNSRYRHLGWTFVVLFVLLVLGGKSRPDRIASSYVVVFAAGSALLSECLRNQRALRFSVVATMVIFGLVLTPVGLPLLPAPLTATIVERLGVVPQIEKGPGKRAALPQWQADRYDWPSFVDDVERVYLSLRPEERTHTVIYASGYGDAGAIELAAAERGLPPVYASHNSYFFWGPPATSPTTVIAIAVPEPDSNPPRPPQRLRDLFEEVELGTQHHCQWCMAWRNRLAIWVARRPKTDLREVWPRLARFD